MLVTFYCDTCEAKLRITADAMGSDLVCPECETELTVPNMTLGPGFVVGGFLIKHKIGEGGMGEVYLATQLSLERDVALKILPSRFTRERSFVVRFLKEVHYQAKLDHPNVVAAFDAGEDGGVYYMAMAYVDGETLEERLDREGPLPEKDALQVMRQVGLALKYASEEKGLLHRDIKPGNIMVTPTFHAKVLDMGLSKNTLEKKSSTMVNTLLGTPNYMSPEQIEHPNDLDTRSDMFSVGMTLYHMLTGQVPYEESSYLNTLKRHAGEQLEDPRKLMPGIAPHTVHVLARLLARDPDHRYATWDACLHDLQQAMSHGILPDLPEGPTCLTVDAGLETLPSEESSPVTVPRDASVRTRTPRGVGFSVVIGMVLGGLIVMMLSLLVPREPADALPPDSETLARAPEPTQVSVPTALPTPITSEYQRELTRLILEYEQDPGNYDDFISRVVDLGVRAEDTPVAEEAALLIVRVRRDRDAAVEKTRDELRQQTLKQLYEQGSVPARAYLNQYSGPFREELQGQISNLRRRIRIWEQQKEEQRDAEVAAARAELQTRTRKWIPSILNRDWDAALEKLDQAARDPLLFPVAEEVAALRREIIDLRDVPEVVWMQFGKKKGQKVTLQVQGQAMKVTILGVQPDGLHVRRDIIDEQGEVLGSFERTIAFSQLDRGEVMRQLEPLEGTAAQITRALLAYRNGDLEASREELVEAGTPLADAIRNHIFALPTLDMF